MFQSRVSTSVGWAAMEAVGVEEGCRVSKVLRKPSVEQDAIV